VTGYTVSSLSRSVITVEAVASGGHAL
jgi:hypothetical protein